MEQWMWINILSYFIDIDLLNHLFIGFEACQVIWF